MFDFGVSVIVGNWRYRLKKSRSTVIRHLYGKINQNLPKSNLQNQIKRESEQKEKTHNIKGKWTYIRPLIELTSSFNWNSYMPRSIALIVFLDPQRKPLILVVVVPKLDVIYSFVSGLLSEILYAEIF